MSRKLDDLSDEFRPIVFEFLARLVEHGIHVLIVETRRTQKDHEDNVRRGVSWAQHSKHIDGNAIDIVPQVLLATPNWSPEHPLWERIGLIAEALGLKWGGRWKKRDCCHFEL